MFSPHWGRKISAGVSALAQSNSASTTRNRGWQLWVLGSTQHHASGTHRQLFWVLGEPQPPWLTPCWGCRAERSGDLVKSSSADQTPTLEQLQRMTMIHRLPLGFYRCSSSFQAGQDRCKPSPDVVWTHLPCKNLSLILLTGIGQIKLNSLPQIYHTAHL